MKIKKARPLICILLIFLTVSLVVGCATVEEQWKETRNCNNKKCYEQFLAAHPDSEFSKEAQKILTEIKVEESRQKEIDDSWKVVNGVVNSREQISQLSYINYGCRYCLSVESHEPVMVTTALPSISLVYEYIAYYILDRGAKEYTEMEYKRDRYTKNKLRMRIYKLKREVLAENNYWEYLYFDFSLYPAGSNSTYELSLTMSGKFSAGGLPSDVKGYNDMITEGYSGDLTNYASHLVSSIKDYIESKQTFSPELNW